MIQKCDWKSDPENPLLIGKTPQNKHPFVLVYLTKSFMPTPHPVTHN